MPTNNNGIITTTVCVGQSLIFTQSNDFISIMGQLAALLNERLLVCSNSPSMLCGHRNTAFHQINGSDELEYYTHSLRSYLRKNIQAVAMPPPKLTHLGVFKGMT